jgi:non-homologous end joining protein Ku
VAARRRTPRKPTRNASSRPRIIWRGAISFGLVHVPVVLYPATHAHVLDLDLIDKRDVRAGRMHASTDEAEAAPRSAEVIDLFATLKKSLHGEKGARAAEPGRGARRARHPRSHRRERERKSA